MSRSVSANTTVNIVPNTNTAVHMARVVHPAGHTITLYADGGFWDETSNKGVLPQDLNRT